MHSTINYNYHINSCIRHSLLLSPRCSAYRQVHGIQFLHSTLFSAFLFILSYDSTNSSSSIPFRGLPLGLFPSILPSITSLNNPSPVNTCPIQFFWITNPGFSVLYNAPHLNFILLIFLSSYSLFSFILLLLLVSLFILILSSFSFL